ncbi:hypothetical protein [Brevundimonas balnearis]|uniref:Uncharacterized protein n=1 Tax=Brevundimonas balnearis TaxID=1572858 RepID=A0ABV6R1C2_9CAUL
MKTSLCETLCDSSDRLTAVINRYVLALSNGSAAEVVDGLRASLIDEARAAKATSDAARAVLAQATAALPDLHHANDLHPSPPSAA